MSGRSMRARNAAPSRLVVISQAAAAATAGVLALGGVVAISPEGLAAFPITDLWSRSAGPTTTAQAAVPDITDLVTSDPERLFPVPTGPEPPVDTPRDEPRDETPETPETEPTTAEEPTTVDPAATPQVLPTTAPPAQAPEPEAPAEEPKPEPPAPAPTGSPSPTTKPEPKPQPEPKPEPKPTPTPSPKPTTPATKPTPTPTCTRIYPGNGGTSANGQGTAGPGKTGDTGVGARCNGVGPTKK